MHIVHLMLLSWGGSSLDEAEVGGAKVEQEVVRAVQELHAYDVVHTDVRDVNVLSNGETGRVMVIDFELAELAEQRRPALTAIMPNKRRRIEDVDDDEEWRVTKSAERGYFGG